MFVAAIVVMFVACDREEVKLIDDEKSNELAGIPVYLNEAEFSKAVKTVNNMSADERLEWEKSMGFKSLGSISDEFYEKIDPEKQFKSFDEIIDFVNKNSEKIEIIEDENGEKYCLPIQFNNSTRYLINESNKFIVGDDLFGIIDGELYMLSVKDYVNGGELLRAKLDNDKLTVPQKDYMPNSNVERLTFVGKSEIKRLLKTDNYKMEVELVVEPQIRNDFGVYFCGTMRAIHIRNYARSLGIWWTKKYYTTFNITLRGTDNVVGDFVIGNNELYSNVISSETIFWHFTPYNVVAAGQCNTGARITGYSVYAENEKGCIINE